MPIPQSQLETWSNIGSIGVSTKAYNSIRTALFKAGSPILVPDEDVFLQGSYANSTNIYEDSDIDVVVLHKKSFHKDMSSLNTVDQAKHASEFDRATLKLSFHLVTLWRPSLPGFDRR